MDPTERIPRRLLALVIPLYLLVILGLGGDKFSFLFSYPTAAKSEMKSSSTDAAVGDEEIRFDEINKPVISPSRRNRSAGALAQSFLSREQSSDAQLLDSKEESSDSQALVSTTKPSDAHSLRGSQSQSSDQPSLTSQNQTPNVMTSVAVLKQNLQNLASGLARAFSPKDLDAWCTKEGYTTLHKKENDPNPETHPYWLKSPKGLLYVKVPKAASSTLAGVVDRIAHNHGGCDFKDSHIQQGTGYLYGNRDKSASFLLGSIRDPSARAISRIFFQKVSQKFQEPTDENMLIWLNDTDRSFGTVSAGQGGFQLKYMDPNIYRIEQWSAYDWSRNTTVKNPKQVEENVRRVIEEYDFMVVVERMDESLVVLQMLLGVDLGDLLTLDSKVQGSYYYTGTNGCIQLVNSHVSPRVKEYLTSDVWYAQNYGDYLLQAAANESLERTIEALGRDRVEQGLVEYRRLKAMAIEKCASRAVFACSEKGVAQRDTMNCYSSDHGCGYSCIDEMLSSKEIA
jgi:hypothetical protein